MMTKFRMCALSTALGREPNTVLPSLMDPRRWLAAAVLLVVVGCQAPAPAAPTPAAPTATAAAPTATAGVPTVAPVVPTVATQPTPPAATASRVDTLNA